MGNNRNNFIDFNSAQINVVIWLGKTHKSNGIKYKH